jgi:hypothetical protein
MRSSSNQLAGLHRYLLQEWVRDAAKANNIWDAVDLVMKQKGWQIVILLHIAPFVPFTAMNYVMGATDMPFSTYLWASAVGTIPGEGWFGSCPHVCLQRRACLGLAVPPCPKKGGGDICHACPWTFIACLSIARKCVVLL